MPSSVSALAKSVRRDPTFDHSITPTMIIGKDLRIVTVNRAYAAATLTRAVDVAGSRLFEVFPDNPDTPDAHSTANLASSIEAALRQRRMHRMGVQRYDVRDPAGSGFVPKTWLPVNTPIHGDSGDVIAVLHQADEIATVPEANAVRDDRDLLALLAKLTTRSEHLEAENRQLKAALTTNRAIGTAVGIVMSARGMSKDEAFALMEDAATAQGVKLSVIASRIVTAQRGGRA